jgi:hypothetical protein
MTFTELSAACEDTGSPFYQTFHYEGRIKATGTHYPDGP